MTVKDKKDLKNYIGQIWEAIENMRIIAEWNDQDQDSENEVINTFCNTVDEALYDVEDVCD